MSYVNKALRNVLKTLVQLLLGQPAVANHWFVGRIQSVDYL